MPEIRKFLTLSTAHVTNETRLILDETPIKDWPVFGFNGVFGWVIYVHEEQEDLEIPQELWAVFDYARKNGCDYVMFDADADMIDDLPHFEW